MYKVLIVDDEQWIREGLKKMITEAQQSFMVTATAGSGYQALKLLEDEPFDLLITDVRMPMMDGLELLRELKGRSIDVPVVMVSGYNEFSYAQQALKYRAFDYLLKPIGMEEVVEVLNNALQWIEQKGGHEYKHNLPVTSGDISCARLVRHLVEHIEQNYVDDFSLNELSEQFGYNPAYLGRLFKEQTGKGFAHYVTDIRMEKAMRLLIETQLSITSIRKQIGYWDDQHFSKLFKRKMGCPPSEFRAKFAKEEKEGRQ